MRNARDSLRPLALHRAALAAAGAEGAEPETVVVTAIRSPPFTGAGRSGSIV